MLEKNRIRSLTVATLFAATGVMGVGVTDRAEAATVKTTYYAGNDCSGVFGQGFENCKDPTGSPVIAKYDTADEDSPGVWTINSMFSGVLSSMFNLVYSGDGKTGSWTYTPGSCTTCPVVTSYTAKAGNGFNWFYTDPKEAIYSGSWTTPGGKGLSHITFYDTAPPPAPVPLPAAGFLLIGALGGLGLMKRRRKAA